MKKIKALIGLKVVGLGIKLYEFAISEGVEFTDKEHADLEKLRNYEAEFYKMRRN